ncbi:pyridoxamine 5'-phosphate oxidase family protein [Chondromyces apiculatus]|uniref:General stress protein n=1 Tax=Chondromyces apiculatus DSM 436 TaxID=1192034 RepID=A0A017SZV7_9BACT|nr:pyridoxamine 5'-phosphate oxidase family protein [Chondromyces apiculatus]EYF01851.1 general stress protein [Chondromyces apiculatus DSM 436]
MSAMTLPELAKKMGDIDFAMLMTRTEGGEIAGRPMSNNKDVAYDGDSFYFTQEESRMVGDIVREARVALSFQGNKGLLGKPGIMIAVEGRAELIRDKEQFKKHWVPDLERWFEKGVDTPGLVLIKVHATRIHYWDGEDEGEIVT